MTNDEPRDKLAALYPVGEKQPERVRTRQGRALSDLTLDNVLAGRLTAADFAITGEGLRLQAAIAGQAGRPHLTRNLQRGAELVAIPDELLLEVYELLRPGRARSAADLRAMADRLRQDYEAEETPRLIEEAAAAYERRGIFDRSR
jgi:propanediol dehydratase small subunit